MIKLPGVTLLLLWLLSTTNGLADEPVLVAVAANFSPVAKELALRYTAQTGEPVKIISGASGTLTRQIQRGAPFQLFLSADEAYIESLYREGLTIDRGTIYAQGVLVLYVPYNSRLDRMQNINGLFEQIAEDEKLKLALPNPAIAPYGRAAQNILQRFDIGDHKGGQKIIGENVGQTAQFALTDNVDAALISCSLALHGNMQEAGHFELIPSDWYPPIRQRMALLRNAGNTAIGFYHYLGSDSARQVIHQSGYTLPEKD